MMSPSLARAFRAMIRPPSPTHVLLSFDYSAFHVLTTGFEALCPEYIRLARLDMHSFVVAHMLKLQDHERLYGLADDELAVRLAEIKNQTRPEYQAALGGKGTKFVRNRQAKPGVLGIGFGLRENHFYEDNQESFESKGAVVKLFQLLRGLFGRVFRWQGEVRQTAHDQAKLITKHGYQRWFFDVFHWEARRGQLVPGKDHEAVVAYHPANDAHGHIKDAALALDWGYEQVERLGDQLVGVQVGPSLLDRYEFILPVHDELLFHCPVDLVDEAKVVVPRIMQAPSAVLVNAVAPSGLWCGVEGKIGPNWAEMRAL